MPAWAWVLVFAVAAWALVRSAVSLAVAGDDVAAATGLGGVLVGTVLVAAATSLPEIVTDVSAVIAGAPDLAVGDLFGSSMANMAILAVIDLRYRGRVWPSVELAHARVAAVAIGLTALVTLGILTPPGLRLGWVGLDTLGVGAAYVAAVAWFRRSPMAARAGGLLPETPTTAAGTPRVERPSSGPAFRRFLVAALGILVAAPVVAIAARELADVSGVAETTVGAVLVAITTSLPELVTSLAAVRIGAHDLAVGNLFGSNAANMAVLLIADVAYTDGPLLAAVDPSQATAALGAILLMGLAMAAIVTGSETRVRRLEPDAVLLLVAYVGALVAVAVAA